MNKTCREILLELEQEGVDVLWKYKYPEPIPSERRMRDILESDVDEKYYLSKEQASRLVLDSRGRNVKEVGFIKKSENGTKHQSNTVYSKDGLARTLTVADYKSPQMFLVNEDIPQIRMLTPLEFWRLMGFDDESFKRAESVVVKTQLYKQAGNSIVVDVLEGIFKNLLKAN